ncbi:hypothetical protein Tco_0247409 [Tanacetum coccineum]
MGNENHIRTLGDYSNPSHEGFRNTIELPIGNNVVPLRSDAIWEIKGRNKDGKNRVKKAEKITRYPDTEDLESINECKFLETLMKKASFHTPKSVSPKSLYVKHVHTIFPNPPLVRESTFGFKPGTRNNRNIKYRHDAENLDPQSTPQVLPSFKEYTPPVTYPGRSSNET